MAYSPSLQFPTPLAFDIIILIVVGKHNYVPEPPMEEDKAMIWASQVIVPFSISGSIHAFLGTSPVLLKNFNSKANSSFVIMATKP